MRNASLNTINRTYFNVLLLDGITPALSEGGGQSQISINGSPWSNSGISTLTGYSFGYYYADIQATVFDVVGDIIQTRYKSAVTQETMGDSFIVVSTLGTPYDPTLAQLALISYVELNEAELYFANRLNSDVWNDSTNNNKSIALRNATKQIDRLNFVGIKTNPNQLLEFPRKPDVLVINDIKIATCEIAIELLDDKDINEEINNLYAEQRSYAGIRTQYDRNINVEHLRAGIISPKAWMYLKPYLIVTKLNLSKVRIS